LRPKQGGDWEDNDWEFEEQDRSLTRYHFWSKITFSAVVISMLLLFLILAV
jgi:hypothetical protein